MVQVGAPRPVWIMDGRWDRCALPALPVTDVERQAIFEKWHRDCEAGREAIRAVYRLLGGKFRDRIRAVERTAERQSVSLPDLGARDVVRGNHLRGRGRLPPGERL